MAEKSGRSPWVYVVLGCVGFVALAFVVVVGLGFFGVKKLQQMGEDFKNPELQAEKVREVLGADELPPGYEPAMAFSIPFAMDMAILSDREMAPGESPGDSGELFEQRGFLYFSMPSSAKQRRELDDFFEGRIDDTEFLRQSSINLQRGEVVARGSFSQENAEVRWIAQRGGLADGGMRAASTQSSLTTTVLVECEGSSRLRLGMWIGETPADEPEQPAESEEGGALAAETAPGEAKTAPAPEVEAPLEAAARGAAAGEEPVEEEPGTDAASFRGTVADEEEIQAFLSYFRFCSAS